jgi:hypothetical protein
MRRAKKIEIALCQSRVASSRLYQGEALGHTPDIKTTV